MLSTTKADGNVISFAGIWSKIKVLDKLKFWPDDGAWGKVKGSPKSLGLLIQNLMATHPLVVGIFQSEETDIAIPWAAGVAKKYPNQT